MIIARFRDPTIKLSLKPSDPYVFCGSIIEFCNNTHQPISINPLVIYEKKNKQKIDKVLILLLFYMCFWILPTESIMPSWCMLARLYNVVP